MITVNNKPIEQFNFPGGEVQVVVPFLDSKDGTIKVQAIIKNSDDILALILVKSVLDREYGDTYKILYIPYLPYARQDRVCGYGQASSAKVMGTLINNLSFDEVELLHPHSESAVSFIDNSTCLDLIPFLCEHLLKREFTIRDRLALISPDAGAYNFVKLLSYFDNSLGIKHIYKCKKTRDLATGDITGMDFEKETFPPRSHPSTDVRLVVDDICDGGRTFVEIGKHYKDKVELYLYVTHGIFSKGLDELKKYYKQVYCFHTFLEPGTYDKDFLTVIGDL